MFRKKFQSPSNDKQSSSRRTAFMEIAGWSKGPLRVEDISFCQRS
jgi:hypothetical protein